MNKKRDIAWNILQLQNANNALHGIGLVMNAILDAEGDADSNCILRHNGFIKGALINGVCVLTDGVALRLEHLEKMVL